MSRRSTLPVSRRAPQQCHHASTIDPDARPFRKGDAHEAEVSYTGHAQGEPLWPRGRWLRDAVPRACGARRGSGAARRPTVAGVDLPLGSVQSTTRAPQALLAEAADRAHAGGAVRAVFATLSAQAAAWRLRSARSANAAVESVLMSIPPSPEGAPMFPAYGILSAPRKSFSGWRRCSGAPGPVARAGEALGATFMSRAIARYPYLMRVLRGPVPRLGGRARGRPSGWGPP